jgi:hypothetical protein
MQPGQSLWHPDRTLAREALLKRAVACQAFFEDCLSQQPGWDWAIKGVWYSKHFRHCLESSPTRVARCRRLGQIAQRRFRCSHPPALAILGKDVVNWVQQEFGTAGPERPLVQ